MENELWQSVCSNVSIPNDITNNWNDKIEQKYSLSTLRHYHNQNMLKFKVNLLKELLPNSSDRLVFAIFFQYYEYDSREDCTTKNLNAFKSFWDESGVNNDELLKSVMCLLGDTSLTYNIEDIQQDLNLFQDLDLAVFGAPNEIYQEYTDQLQKEYSHMDVNSYKKMRLKILQTFLTIPYIYTTEKFRNKYEEIARGNIKNEISELQK